MWESVLLCRETVAEDTVACVLRRPTGFSFEPGQYVEMSLVAPSFTDRQGSARAMSIASAPSDDDLLVLMRIRDTAFKRSIVALVPGAPVILDGPADDLSVNTAPGGHVVMLAGGVGVAPFRALLREIAATTRKLDGTLFYSNRRPEDAPYLEELEALAGVIAGLRFVPTMTRMSDSRSSWHGNAERLSAEMIRRYVLETANPRYYLSGSTLFVSGLCYDLERSGVPARDIRVEMYAGY